MLARTPVVRIAVFSTIFGALTSVSACMAQGYSDPANPVDPPGRVARISVLQGDVSLEPAGTNSFSQAELNYPLTLGDRMYVDLQALSELETAGLAVRMSNGADVTLTTLTDAVAQFGLAQGSIRVSSREVPAPDGSTGVIEIDTPNGTVWVQAPGDIRIDAYPQNNTSVVTVTTGQVEIVGANLDQTVGPNQSVQLTGTNPVTAQFVGPAAPDALDQFDQSREGAYQSTVAEDSQYVSSDVIGGEDLVTYGAWTPDVSYGAVWYPRSVAVDWVPYHNGRWVYIPPWGWTWVEAEPWGFAPFHYGRWVNLGGRWGWIPGPPPSVFGRPIRPVYSPALVAFVGGSGFGVTAWFPLGPGEAFVPWYATSTAYVNRVNVTNIYSRNAVQVRAGLANRTTNLYGSNTSNIVYANRNAGITAVNQSDFAAGRSVARSQPVRMDANLRQQLNQAPVAVRPTAAPIATGVARAPARALPPVQARPQLPTRSTEVHGTSAAPINRNLPGGDRIIAPAPIAPQPRTNTPPANNPQPRPYAPPAAATPEPRVNQPAPVVTTPRVNDTPRPEATPRQVEPEVRQREMPQQQPQQPPRQQPQAQPAPQQQAPRTQPAPAHPAPPKPAEPEKKEPPK